MFDRGYTSHEHLLGVNLINMNGNENDVDLGNTVTNNHGGNTIGNTGGGYMKSKRPKKPVKGGPKYPTLKPKS